MFSNANATAQEVLAACAIRSVILYAMELLDGFPCCTFLTLQNLAKNPS
jgi:hypothetical protein